MVLMKRYTILVTFILLCLSGCAGWSSSNEESSLIDGKEPTIGIDAGVKTDRKYFASLDFDNSAAEFSFIAYYDGSDGRDVLCDRLQADPPLPAFIQLKKREQLSNLRTRYTFTIEENPTDTVRGARIIIVDSTKPKKGPWAKVSYYMATGTVLVTQSAKGH